MAYASRMRKRRLPSVAYLLLVVPVAAMAAIAACGGEDNGNGDAGPDATTDVQPDIAKLDTGPDVLDASCANDVDLTQYLPSADASIDVDAGGLNIAACTGCLKTSCGTDINACNGDCDCRQGVIDLVTCVGGGGDLQSCFLNALTSGNTDLQNLVGCASSSCLSICLGTGGDGGTTDSGSSDAANDGD